MLLEKIAELPDKPRTLPWGGAERRSDSNARRTAATAGSISALSPAGDVTESGGDSFSLEAGDGVRFAALSRSLEEE
jgi:hypothetical protein